MRAGAEWHGCAHIGQAIGGGQNIVLPGLRDFPVNPIEPGLGDELIVDLKFAVASH